MNHTMLIAHRGESFDAPENTLAATHLAWQRGVAAVEIDIRLTRDHKIVVFHDETTWRLAAGCGRSSWTQRPVWKLFPMSSLSWPKNWDTIKPGRKSN